MPQHIRSAWLKTLGTLALLLGAAVVAGVLIGHVWMALTLTALGVLAWHYWRLRQVLRRLTARQRAEPAAGIGAWNELDRLLYRSQAEMRARKRRLIEMLRTYRAAAQALPDAVVVVDRNSQRVQWFNKAAGGLLGLHHPGDMGVSIVERLQPLAHWLAAGRNAEPMLDAASPADPDLRLNLRLIPYSDDYWLLVARDVSKLLRLEQVRRDFVANVSHELRTPLTVVHGYLDMLDPEDFPDSGPMLAEMRKQSQRMAQLVEDLLTLSRLESQEELGEEHVAMAPMLSTLRREAEAHSQGRHTVEVIDEAGVDLLGSNKELHSAFSKSGDQCGALHARRRHGDDPFRARRRWCGAGSARHRLWHSRLAPAAHHRTLLPRLQQPLARKRRHRAGAIDRQAHPGAASGAPGHRKRSGTRQRILVSFRACARRAARAIGATVTLGVICSQCAPQRAAMDASATRYIACVARTRQLHNPS